jgi:hypothetical protein
MSMNRIFTVHRTLTVNWFSIVFLILGIYTCVVGLVSWWTFALIFSAETKFSTEFHIRTPW